MTYEETTEYSEEFVQKLLNRGNQIIKRNNIVKELNRIGIRRDDQPQKHEDLAEISATLALIEQKTLEQACKVLGSSEDDVKWL